jgi:hypothetical protein
MSVNIDKIADNQAEGYLSVQDVYLAGKGVWASNSMSKFNVFEGEPRLDECNKEVDTGKIGVLVNSEKLYICTGGKGWKILGMKGI